jgi:transposase
MDARERGRAGYDGAMRRKGSKVHASVDTLGNLLAVTVPAVSKQERRCMAELAREVQEATGDAAEVAYVDQGYTGEEAANQAAGRGVRPVVVRRAGAKQGFVLLPRRWVVKRSFAWPARCRRLARDYERLTTTLAGWHRLAFLTLLLGQITGESA